MYIGCGTKMHRASVQTLEPFDYEGKMYHKQICIYSYFGSGHPQANSVPDPLYFVGEYNRCIYCGKWIILQVLNNHVAAHSGISGEKNIS